ncbi:hypothetical protein [Fulvivirga ligni]|uniref:hypothetical protein n=1 Tax=Fulvivirga ligni TaxID=2904246 RepID=UPI001F417C2B|nr:hypothetical protein [Fulvivirga ligni]UII23988.1 hypothetical protein LVD16_12240 [Fulvivirga ligni]
MKPFLKNICLIILLLAPFFAHAQETVSINVQVLPPYGSGFNNFGSKVIVTLRNNATFPMNVALDGQLQSSGLNIDLNPSSAVYTLNALQVLQVTGAQLQPYFNEMNVEVKGITKDELYRGDGLPSGNYDLCLNVIEANTGAVLVSNPGCFPFTILQEAGENSVNLTTQVIPPYSTYLDDYINQNKLLVILQNKSRTQSEDLRLIGSIEGNNGVRLTIPNDFIPTAPIRLGPAQTLTITSAFLREYFDENTLRLTGIDREGLYRGNGLPEGSYQVCLQAVDYETGEARSPGSPAGCSFIDIRQYEPPMIIQPVCDAEVPAVKPQNLLFSWSIPAGVRPNEVEYILKIVEMYPQNINPNQAVQAANVPPLFEKVVPTNAYIYSLADPRLEEGKRYAFRVTAVGKNSRRRKSQANFRNNGHSEVCTFVYGKKNVVNDYVAPVSSPPNGISINPKGVLVAGPPSTSPPPADNDDDACLSGCSISAPTNTSTKEIAPGQVVQAGKFSMTVVSGNSAHGTGTIPLAFMNTVINVSWNNIQVNTDNQMFGAGSKITADMDLAALQNNAVVNAPIDNPNLPDVSALMDMVQSPSRRYSMFSPGNTSSIGLPLAYDNGNFDLIILGIIFTSTEAQLNTIAAVEMLSSSQANDFLTLSSTSCIRPNGFGPNNQLKLQMTKEVPFAQHASMQLQANTTMAEFSCAGIEQITLNGKMVFDRDLVLPVNNSGSVISGSETVEASFEIAVTDVNNWTFDLTALNHPFTIPELVGMKFTASDITIDQSDTQTPNGMGQPASWRGIFIGEINMQFPDGVFKKNGTPLSISVQNFSLGNNGFSGEVDAGEVLMSMSEGKVGSWPLSLDEFSLQISNSSIAGSNISGSLKLPIASNELSYNAILLASENESQTVDFQFNVQQSNQLNVDMWFAQVELEETSTIGIQKVGNTYRPTADLTGSISLGWDNNSDPDTNNSVSNFSLPSLNFEHFTITDNGNNLPEINIGAIENANGNGVDLQLSVFSAHSTTPTFQKQGDLIGLSFNLNLELINMANSLNGSTAFTIFAKYTNNKFEYKKTQLNHISLDGDIGVARLDGSIDIYQDDAKYGNGFRGEIEVVINALGGAGIDAVLQVGKVDGFRYWYFDIMANLGTAGFNIPGTMASIYGIGGGAYGNMARDQTEAQTVQNLNAVSAYDTSPGANKDGLNYVPDQGTFGFSAAVAFGLTGAKSAFNGDLKFTMELKSNGAVNHVILEGNGYVMQDITDRSSGLITGGVYAEIQPRIPNAAEGQNAAENRPNFRFIAEMSLDIASGLITGGATLDLWFSPQEWWLKLGEWTNEDKPWLDESRSHIAIDLKIVKTEFHSYFMMGSNIPDMPKMPLKVRNIFADKKESLNPSPRIGLLSTNDPEAVPASPGMAFGAGSHFYADIDYLIFYADIEFIKGFDILLKKLPAGACGPGAGVNGWYAKGQAYFYLYFDVGVQLNLWVWKGKASILEAEAAATIQAALPNPTWLKGQFAVKGEVLNGLFDFNTKFRFEIGEKCEEGSSNPFEEMPIVSDIMPNKNEQDVSVYVVPELAFNFPKGNFSYDEEVDGELVTKTYKYIFKSFELKYKDPNTNQTVIIDLKPHMNYRPDDQSATFYYPDMVLPEHTIVNYTIYVQGWQVAPGADKKVHDESHTGTFKSGSWPKHIAKEQLVQGAPQYKENFFKKDDLEKGYLKFRNPHNHFTNKAWWYEEVFKLGQYKGASSGNFKFFARFKELKTNTIFDRVYTMADGGKKMEFNVPDGLKNNDIYQLELYVNYLPPNAGGPVTNTKRTYQNILVASGEGAGGGTGSFVYSGISQQQGQSVNNMQLSSGMQVMAANYNAVNSFSSAPNSPEPEPPAPGVNISQLVWGGNGGDGTYIKRQKQQLISKTKGDQGLLWPLFDDLPWYFKTSRFNTLQDKLNSIKTGPVLTHEYADNFEMFNSSDFVHEHAWDIDGSKYRVRTNVPVVLLEIEEAFEKPYEVGGYTITIANNQNETIDVPPQVSIMNTSPYDDWVANHFYGSPGDAFKRPDDDDWAKLEYYDNEEGMYVDHYQTLNIPYPGIYWENFEPGIDGTPWLPTRLSSCKYLGSRNLPTVYQMMSSTHKPFQEFYQSITQNGPIDFQNKEIFGFKTTLLENDKINNALQQGGAPSPSSSSITNLYLQAVSISPGVMGATSFSSNAKRYMAVIDYTEWVTMRDYYLLQKYIYTMNEEEEGVFFTECQSGKLLLDIENGINCYYPGIKNYVNNIMHYSPRPGGSYSIKLGNEDTSREYFFSIDQLNPEH